MIGKENSFPHGGILCDEMGLGKTIEILGLIKSGSKGPTLLIAPLCTLDQWQLTAEKCGFQVWRADKDESQWLLPKNFKPSAHQLYVINYERALRRESLVADRVWHRLVCDEAHRLAKSDGALHLLIKKIDASKKWFLTATPIVNGLGDAVSLFNLLGLEKVPRTIKSIEPLVKDLVMCRTMEQLRSTIPELPSVALQTTHHLDFSTIEEQEFYQGIQGAIVRRWKALASESNRMTERFRLIMCLRQISIHPQVYISARKKEFANYSRPDWVESSTKFEMLRSLIEMDTTKNHRWIVFCHFRDEMTMLQEFLLDSMVVKDCQIYNGGMNELQKRDAIQESKQVLTGLDQEVILVQLQSGSVGLNLQHCDRIAFMGPWWTAALMDQAIGRAVRIGQKERVHVHHLILKEEATLNIDRAMLDAAQLKRDLCSKFLEMAFNQNATHS